MYTKVYSRKWRRRSTISTVSLNCKLKRMNLNSLPLTKVIWSKCSRSLLNLRRNQMSVNLLLRKMIKSRSYNLNLVGLERKLFIFQSKFRNIKMSWVCIRRSLRLFETIFKIWISCKSKKQKKIKFWKVHLRSLKRTVLTWWILYRVFKVILRLSIKSVREKTTMKTFT